MSLYYNTFDYKRYGKFLDFALLDNRTQNIQFSYNATNAVVALTVPHFWERVGMFNFF